MTLHKIQSDLVKHFTDDSLGYVFADKVVNKDTLRKYEFFFKMSNCLFEITPFCDNKQSLNWCITPDIKLKPCEAYNKSICSDQCCQSVHICQQIIINKECSDQMCTKYHEFYSGEHNARLFEQHKLHVDPSLLFKFYQDFYESESSYSPKENQTPSSPSIDNIRSISNRPSPSPSSGPVTPFSRLTTMTVDSLELKDYRICVRSLLNHPGMLRKVFDNEIGEGKVTRLEPFRGTDDWIITFNCLKSVRRLLEKKVIRFQQFDIQIFPFASLTSPKPQPEQHSIITQKNSKTHSPLRRRPSEEFLSKQRFYREPKTPLRLSLNHIDSYRIPIFIEEPEAMQPPELLPNSHLSRSKSSSGIKVSELVQKFESENLNKSTGSGGMNESFIKSYKTNSTIFRASSLSNNYRQNQPSEQNQHYEQNQPSKKVSKTQIGKEVPGKLDPASESSPVKYTPTKFPVVLKNSLQLSIAQPSEKKVNKSQIGQEVPGKFDPSTASSPVTEVTIAKTVVCPAAATEQTNQAVPVLVSSLTAVSSLSSALAIATAATTASPATAPTTASTQPSLTNNLSPDRHYFFYFLTDHSRELTSQQIIDLNKAILNRTPKRHVRLRQDEDEDENGVLHDSAPNTWLLISRYKESEAEILDSLNKFEQIKQDQAEYAKSVLSLHAQMSYSDRAQRSLFMLQQAGLLPPSLSIFSKFVAPYSISLTASVQQETSSITTITNTSLFGNSTIQQYDSMITTTNEIDKMQTDVLLNMVPANPEQFSLKLSLAEYGALWVIFFDENPIFKNAFTLTLNGLNLNVTYDNECIEISPMPPVPRDSYQTWASRVLEVNVRRFFKDFYYRKLIYDQTSMSALDALVQMINSSAEDLHYVPYYVDKGKLELHVCSPVANIHHLLGKLNEEQRAHFAEGRIIPSAFNLTLRSDHINYFRLCHAQFLPQLAQTYNIDLNLNITTSQLEFSRVLREKKDHIIDLIFEAILGMKVVERETDLFPSLGKLLEGHKQLVDDYRVLKLSEDFEAEIERIRLETHTHIAVISNEVQYLNNKLEFEISPIEVVRVNVLSSFRLRVVYREEGYVERVFAAVNATLEERTARREIKSRYLDRYDIRIVDLFDEFYNCHIEVENSRVLIRGEKNEVLNLENKLIYIINQLGIEEINRIYANMKAFGKAKWRYQSIDRHWVNFSVFLSMSFEESYKDNKTNEIIFQTAKNEKARVVFNRSNKREAGRFEHGNLSHVCSRVAQEVLQAPSSWNKEIYTYDLSEREFTKIRDLFIKTIHDFGDVLEIDILRIQNRHLYSQYQIYKKNIIESKPNAKYQEYKLFYGNDMSTIFQVLLLGFNINIKGLGMSWDLFLRSGQANDFCRDFTRNDRCMLLVRNFRLDSEPYDRLRDVYPCSNEFACLPLYLIKYKIS